MTPAVRVDRLSRRYRYVAALDDLTVTLREGAVHGLLGRNGAGKTTLLQILAGLVPPTGGRAEVFGADPFENAGVVSRICLVRESQKYPDGYRVRHVLRAAALLLPHWDAAYAARLADDFQLPPGRPVAKLSRGMLSAVGAVVGLASRAPLTLFDEPYLGMDAVSRQRLGDHLLADVAVHPRTVVISTHLIDEIADLLEHVVVLDRGRLVLAAGTDDLRTEAVTVTGAASDVEATVAAAEVLARERLGSVTRATVRTAGARLDAPPGAAVRVEPVSLQRLVVHLTAPSGHLTAPSGPAGTSGPQPQEARR